MSATEDTAKSPSFITLSEFEEFQRPKRFVPRTIVETPIDPQRIAIQSELIAYVKTQLRQMLKVERPWFGCACIQVKEDDGLSWDCEAVDQFVAEQFGHLKLWRLTQRATTDELPIIASRVKLRTFLRLAVANGLTDSFFSFFSLRSWMGPAIIVAALAVGFLIEILKNVQDVLMGANPTIAQVFSDPRFYLVNVALVASGLGAQAVATWMATRTKSAAIEKLAARLSPTEKTIKDNYDRFVHALAQRLRSIDFPRVIIIENFEHLDSTSRLVIDLYFQKYSAQRSGSEFWIVFENENGDRFSNLFLNNPSRGGYSQTKLFQQSLLTEQQKLDLVKLIGKPAEAAEYATVKRVCHSKDSDTEVETFFSEYRVRHPWDEKEYDELDFLFLLSLTADNVFLTQKFILGNLPVKRGLRSEVLSLYLRGTKLRIEEFRGLLSRVQEKFKDFMIVEPDGELTKLKILPERAAVLSAQADDLGLDVGLGHLFWALFWHDRLQHHPTQAIWIRKLARHLLKADSLSIRDDQSYVNIRSKLFEVALFCVDGCLKACLFQHITALLQEAATLLLESDLPKDDLYQKKLRRLLSRCWEVYTILGDEDVLKLIVDLYDAPGKAVSYHRESTRLEKIFFESMPLSAEKRRHINPELLEKIYGRAETNKPIADYAQARASWLVLSAGQLVNSDVCKFISAIIEADSNLPKIAEASFTRINQVSDESVRLTDVTTLSLSLWCSALRFNPAFIPNRIQAAKRAEPPPPKEENQSGSLLDYPLPFLVPQDFSKLLGIAENAVLLADKTRRPASDESVDFAGTDCLMNGLAKELGAISLASTLIAASYFNSLGLPITAQQIEALNEIIKINNDLLGLSLPEVQNLDDLKLPQLLTKVDSLLNLCGVIWKHFGLERLSDFINIRRVHFKAVCLPATAEGLPSRASMLQSVGNSLNKADYAGILANIAAAESLASTGELAAYYLIRAAELALGTDFGKPIKDQLALAAIKASHTYDFNLDIFVRHIIADIAGQQTLLERFLNDVPEQNLVGEILALLNVARRTSDPADVERLMSILQQFVATIQDESMKKEVESLLEYHSIQQQLKKGEVIDLPALLHGWDNRKDLWLYASVLRLLLDHDYSLGKVKQESLSILARDPENDRYNTYFLLSLTLARKLPKLANGESSIPFSYLKRGLDKWQSSLSAATNVQVYKAFYQWDPDNGDYYVTQILKWQVIKMEGDELKRLPRWIAERHFFLIFRYYFEALELWGLQASVSSADLAARLSIPPDQKRNQAASWKGTGAVVPQALAIAGGGHPVVNSDFLVMGSYLFTYPCADDSVFDGARSSYDDRAKSAVDELFQTIRQLPGLPGPMRDLMQSHHKMMSSYSLP